jgi:hypothetical protein
LECNEDLGGHSIGGSARTKGSTISGRWTCSNLVN